MDDPRRKTATVAINEPRKLGNFDQARSSVLLYFSVHVTAIGSLAIRLVIFVEIFSLRPGTSGRETVMALYRFCPSLYNLHYQPVVQSSNESTMS